MTIHELSRIKLIVVFGILLVGSRFVLAQCPAVGLDTTCGTILTINQKGATVTFTGQPPFDGIEDTLVGVRNNSNIPVRALGLRSAATIFGFDGDGLTAYGLPGNALDPTGYGGPNAYFTAISRDFRSGVVNFITPIPPGGTAYFALEESIGSAIACSSIINNAVATPTLGGRGLTSGATTISSTFTPKLGYNLAQAANLCGFADFDWIQKITLLPDPSPFYAVNPGNLSIPIHLTSSSVAFNDPYQNGYTYNTQWVSYPFYWDPRSTGFPWSLNQNKPSSSTLSAFDSPTDPCISGPLGLPGNAWLKNSAVRALCGGTITPTGSYIGFTTHLAGVNFDGTGVDLGVGYKWTSNFNGTSGGIATIGSYQPADPDSGEGGITVTAIDPVTNYEYNGVTVINVNGNPVGSSADLSISNTDGISTFPTGSTLTYTIVATNIGPDNVTGATVTDAFPPSITSTTWTCAGINGGACGASSGTGNISQVVNLPVGASVIYTVAATLNGVAANGFLANTATVTAPIGVTDPNPDNNTATDIDVVSTPSVFVIDDVSKTEGNSGTNSYIFTVSKLGSTGFPTIVQYETRDGSATVADNDYQPASGTLVFGPFETTKTITVLVNGDTKVEPTETFTVHLQFNPVNGVIGDPDGTGTIVNDDFPTPIPTPTATPAQSNGFEGDINRSAAGLAGTGDSDVTVGDQIQYQRFLSGVDCPDAASGEQQRLDAGPRDTLGDGFLGSADGTAIDAYARHDSATDFDPNVATWQPTPAGGPNQITNLGCTPGAGPDSHITPVPEPESVASARILSIVSSMANNGEITVEVQITAQGNEAGTQYGLHFDPALVNISDISGVNANPDITAGADSPAGTNFDVNAENVANGYVGIVENFNGSSDGINAIPEGSRRIARIRFHIQSGATAGESKVTFDDSVVKGSAADTFGFTLGMSFDQNGTITIPATAGTRLSGQVISPDGRAVRNAKVTIADRNGYSRTVTTSSFGYYAFDDVIPGVSYTVGVVSRQYRFASRILAITDSLTVLDFTGQE